MGPLRPSPTPHQQLRRERDVEEVTAPPNPHVPCPFCPEFGPGSLEWGTDPLISNYSSRLSFRTPSWPFSFRTGLGGAWGCLLRGPGPLDRGSREQSDPLVTQNRAGTVVPQTRTIFPAHLVQVTSGERGDPSARLGEWRAGPLCPDPGPCRLQGLPCLLWRWMAGQPTQPWLLRVGHGLGVEALEWPIYDPGLGGSLLTGNPTISTRGIWAASFPASCLGWPEVAGRQTPDPVAFGAGGGSFPRLRARPVGSSQRSCLL